MDIDYATSAGPASPEYVLAVLQDMHRQQWPHDPEADADAVLSFATTVADWRLYCDLVEWRELGRAYNEFWGIKCSDAEWRAVLEPAGQKRLEDVCQLIATHAVRPMIRPARLLGSECLPAGAFLTIRAFLHQAGATVNDIAPSTPLAPYARRYVEVFLGPVTRLAPGALPQVRIRMPIYDVAIGGLFASMLCLLVGACGGLHLLVTAGWVLLFASYTLSWFAARCLLPASVEFGNLRTFRDLALVVAEGMPA